LNEYSLILVRPPQGADAESEPHDEDPPGAHLAGSDGGFTHIHPDSPPPGGREAAPLDTQGIFKNPHPWSHPGAILGHKVKTVKITSLKPLEKPFEKSIPTNLESKKNPYNKNPQKKAHQKHPTVQSPFSFFS
jgi:hypothetical protein